MVLYEIRTLRQRIQHRSFRGVRFDETDFDRLVEHFRSKFFRGARNQKEKERIRAVLKEPSRTVGKAVSAWSGFFLKHARYPQDGPQHRTEVMIRLKINTELPLKKYREQLKKALDLLIYDRKLQASIFTFILGKRKESQTRHRFFVGERFFYEHWFRYIFMVGEDELQKVLTSGPHGQKKWKKHFPTTTPHLTRLPDHAIIAVTLRLLDEIKCAPDDPDALKFRLWRWKRQPLPR